MFVNERLMLFEILIKHRLNRTAFSLKSPTMSPEVKVKNQIIF